MKKQDFERMIKGLQAESARMAASTDKKLWETLRAPFSLREALSTLTKDELHNIRKLLEIPRASSLNKAALTDLLCEQLPHLVENVYTRWEDMRFALLLKLIKQGGMISADGFTTGQLMYFRSTGFIFTAIYEGERVLALPNEFKEMLKGLEKDREVKKLINRNTEWFKLINGLLYHYGTLSSTVFFRFVEKFTGGSLDQTFFSVLDDTSKFYKHIQKSHHAYSHIEVDEPAEILQAQEMRANIEFRPLTKEEIVRAGTLGYIERDECYRKFHSYVLSHYDIEKHDAEHITQEVLFSIKTGYAMGELFEMLQEWFEFPTKEAAEEMADLIVYLNNHTGQWPNKGYGPIELRKKHEAESKPTPEQPSNVFSFETKQKVGRNDACPCGSGKKFKKCCGA
ncbi:SEC-C metal-binding domain-containing protein [Alkalihalophilus marmarensis]|jgi:uncharacterized protein YecA (UPF0149 family)|uniref:YecA family protein n=1 Tax=Alkalihalophilus marmarensis TaxID=521377 RepID=UPI00203EDF5B|nr:SEC-C metal-binding domain-containing protein [Alkalihalophilus marmarensis]MCM3489863.1 SEC-C metal-binding domain-containing protein [Alkalihalophilus marmarensis]